MPIGDSANMLNRLWTVIPRGWARIFSPRLNAVLGGAADVLAWVYSQSRVVLRQARLATTDGFMLDIAAHDFLGMRVRRKVGQSDASFRARVLKEIFRERVTRKAMDSAITDLTGHKPVIFEPWNTADAAAIGFTLAPDTGLPIGSYQYPSQTFITVTRPGNAGIADIAGIDTGAGGVDAGLFAPVSPDLQTGITDAEIYDTIKLTKPTGSVVWVALQ